VEKIDRERIRNYFASRPGDSPNHVRRQKPPAGVSRGRTADLEEIFNQLNEQFFDGQISVEAVHWSSRRAYRRLGGYRSDQKRIVISRLLDHPRVPRYFLEFVLYHEMLHVLLPGATGNGRTRHHHSRFRAMEQAFPHYERAKQFERSTNWRKLAREQE
jgi:predicted metal-dependent hydrolase